MRLIRGGGLAVSGLRPRALVTLGQHRCFQLDAGPNLGRRSAGGALGSGGAFGSCEVWGCEGWESAALWHLRKGRHLRHGRRPGVSAPQEERSAFPQLMPFDQALPKSWICMGGAGAGAAGILALPDGVAPEVEAIGMTIAHSFQVIEQNRFSDRPDSK